jgi:hypothetical protein
MEFVLAGLGLVVAVLMILSARKRHRGGPPRGENRRN